MSRRLLLASGTTATVPDPGTGGPGGDADLFNTAIAEVAATGGVVLFSGTYSITEPITLQSGVWLVGMGWQASRLLLANGANCDVVRTNPSAVVKYAGISGFYINGNRANNTTGHGVNFQNLAPDKSNGQCSVNIAEDILVEHAPVDGFNIGGGQVESRLFNCYTFSSGRDGFRILGSDYWMTDCTSGEAGGDGISLAGQGARLSGCKSWWSGRQNPPGTVANPGAGNGTSVGFRISVENAQITNCEAQDSSGPGAAISGQSGRIQLHIDGNNGAGMGSNPYLLDVAYATRMHIDVNVGYGTGRGVAPYVLNIGAQASGNRIDLWNGATGNTLYRPGSQAAGTNIVNATGTYA